jgi:cyclic-di-GMP phosphodiesterase TipF (flagellum assembly factor)
LSTVKSAVQNDNIDLFMQPVVNLPQRKVRFFETFSRIRLHQGAYLEAGRYIKAALQNDMLPVIDNLLLLRTLQFLRDTEAENAGRAFFCNISSLTLNDPKFMADLVEFIAQNRTLAQMLVFELAQQDLATMSADALPVLDGLSQLGCRFSIDHVRRLSFDFEHLAARHIRFVRVSAPLLLQEMNAIGGLSRLKRLKSELDRAGIDMIVERIETEKQLRELLDIDIDYGQGFLFGKPGAAAEIKSAA